MLAAAAVAELETIESIEVLDAVIAGRPYDPDEPYVPAYAADTLIDEFTRPAPMFIDGREQLMPAAGGARTYHLPEGDVECVYTIHSEQATLPRSYADRGIRTVEWRLGLPPAHTLPLRALVAAGMASTDPVHVDGREVRPRDVLVAVLARQGGAPDDPAALERLRAHVVGTSGGERVEIDADLPLCAAPRVGHRFGHVLDGRAALDRRAAAGERPGTAHGRRRPRGDAARARVLRGARDAAACTPRSPSAGRSADVPAAGARPVSWDRGRSGRVAEGGALLRRYRGLTSVEGSNPSFSVAVERNRCASLDGHAERPVA